MTALSRIVAILAGMRSRDPPIPSQDRLERAAQRFVPEHEAVAERLVRQHALAAQQKLVGEIAADPAQQARRECGTPPAGAAGGRVLR